MLFPKNMTFQYFFFDTYPGYFLQSLPIAILAGALCWFLWFRKKNLPKVQKFWKSVFVCYICGLLCMLLFIDFIGVLWYRILYHSESGMEFRFFEWNYDFRPNPETYLQNAERIVNFLMYLPFGVLHPLSIRSKSWLRTAVAGFLCSVIIELLQPVIGRAFDIDDVILNTAGAAVAAALFFVVARGVRNKEQES